MKENLRKIALKKRAKIDAVGAAEKLARNFMANVRLQKNSIIAGYMPFRGEIDVGFLLVILGDNGHKICLPRISGSEMQFHEYKIGDDLVVNKFGILEPLPTAKVVTPNIIIVPMLAFDRSKNRLGYGGGYYDKYLQNSTALKTGVAYAVQEIEHIPTAPHDAKMGMIVTEQFVL